MVLILHIILDFQSLAQKYSITLKHLILKRKSNQGDFLEYPIFVVVGKYNVVLLY